MKRFPIIFLSVAFLVTFVGCGNDVTSPMQMGTKDIRIIHGTPMDSTGVPGDSTHTTWGKIKYMYRDIGCPEPPEW